MLNEILKTLGFSDKEVLVFLSLMKNGSSTAAVISRKTGLNRTTVYDIFELLTQKGIISKYKKKGATFFFAKNPEELISYLEREKNDYIQSIERKKNDVKTILSELISLQGISNTRPKVQFFEGEKGLREAYEDTLTCRDKILAYTNVQEMFDALPNFFPRIF